jgi:hypothetical protein
MHQFSAFFAFQRVELRDRHLLRLLQPDDKGTRLLNAALIHVFIPCPTSIAAARMRNSIIAARRRKRRHHRNQAHKITCVMMPHGCVTVSVTQYSSFIVPADSPGCHFQPEIQIAAGMINNRAAPTAVRLAINSISSPYSLTSIS